MTYIKPGIYKHSKKGTRYRVIGMAKHSESLEPLVVYEALYDNPESKLWVRPAAMFEEEVVINGEKVPRFVFLEDEMELEKSRRSGRVSRADIEKRLGL